MGFEDALCNLLTCPDESRELVEYVTDWRIDFLTRCFDHLDVDAVFFHDDWGSKNSTFFSPDTFREIFKPSYQRLYGFIKDSGKLLIHHADSYCATLVDDMIDLGINCWQGVLPSNDLPALQKKYNGKIIFQGGFDSGVVDRNDSTEAEIRAHVDEVFRQSARLGAWIPSITNGDPGCIHENAYHIIVDECAKQIELYKTV
jgi:uroporphyrinogen-III decarboxylase